MASLTLEQQKEYIKCALDFSYYARTYLSIEDKTKGAGVYVPFELFPFQENIVDTYEKNDKVLTNKYRQAGITTLTCAYASWKLNFFPKTKIAVVANNLDLAKDELFTKIINFLDGLPDWLYTGIKDGGKNTEKNKIFTNGSQIQARAAGKQGLRGYSPNFVIVDEVAFLEYGYEFWTSAGNSISTGGKVFFISTPNGRDRLFYEIYKGSRAKENDFFINEINWYEDERLNKDLKWVKGKDEIIEKDQNKFKELIIKGYKPTSSWFVKQCRTMNNDPKRIAQELEGKFVGSGGSVIEDEYISYQEKVNVIEPISFAEENENMWIFKKPEEGKKYILTSDVSLGNADDFSTIQILDVETLEQVAEYQGKIPPDILGELIYKWATLYNNAYVVVDITGGYGVTTVLKLRELEYKNLHYSNVKSNTYKDRMDGLENYDKQFPGFVVGENRTWVIESLCRAMRENNIIIRSARSIIEFGTFIYVNNRPDHARGSHDDLLFALAMAVYVIESSFNQINKNIEMTKAMLSSWKVVNAGDRVSDFNSQVRDNNGNTKKIQSNFFVF